MDVQGGCLPNELYALSSEGKMNSIDSMTSMMLGLCGDEIQYPVPSPADAGFTVSLPAKEDDFILRAEEKKCPRAVSLMEKVNNTFKTHELKIRVDNFEEEVIYPHFKERSGLTEDDVENSMHQILNYLYWALENNHELNFDVTEEDRNYIRIVEQAFRGIRLYGYQEEIAKDV